MEYLEIPPFTKCSRGGVTLVWCIFGLILWTLGGTVLVHFVTLGGLFWCIYLTCIARARNAPVWGGQALGEMHQNEPRGPQDPENAPVHFFQSPTPTPLKGGIFGDDLV